MEASFEVDSLIKATGVGSVTLVGYLGDFPRERGNCFSVETEDGRSLRVLNFNHENLEELLEQGVISYPIEVLPLSDRHCAIVDHRISKEWYSKRFCSTCTPADMLPPQQRIERLLDLKSGRRTEMKVSVDGKEFMMIKGPEFLPAGYVWAPYVVCTFHVTKWDRMILRALNAISPKLYLKYYDWLKNNRSSTKVEHNLTEAQMKAYKEKKVNPNFYGTVNPNIDIKFFDRTSSENEKDNGILY